MNKIVVLGILGLVLVGCVSVMFLNNDKEENMEEKIYQGPVRPTDDEVYFRKTGITKPLEASE